MIFSVWAPKAKSVDLLWAAQRIAMRQSEGGHWEVEVDGARAGDRYQYSLDGGQPLPDPRSRWQPDGVHGSSALVDAEELRRIQRSGFRARPMREAVIYELHVGTFTAEGTYQAAERKLEYLAGLGITHVELLPVATFPGRHGWGYDGVDWYAPQPSYGTPQELAGFVAACHRQGMAVLLDVVYNHFGPDGNYLGGFAPYFTDRVKTPWGDAINYDDHDSDGVRSFVIDNAVMWLEDYGFDGLRLDAVHAIYSFEAVHVLEDLADAVRELSVKLNKELVLIAESDLNDPRLVQAAARGGYGLSAHWSDDFHHALHRFFTGESGGYYADFHGLKDIATALRSGYVYQGQYSAYRRRRHGREAKGVNSDQLVVFSQNHDQIGNRAQGERLSMLLQPVQLKAIAGLLLLSPFVPMLFQGEEWGAKTPFIYFTDHENQELARLVTEGRTREFKAFSWQGDVPDPQAAQSFVGSKLNWAELDETGHAQVLAWYRRLIELRHEMLDPLGKRRAQVAFNEDARWLRFAVGNVLVVLNAGDQPRRVPMPSGAWDWVLSSIAGDEAQTPEIPGWGLRVFRRGGGEPVELSTTTPSTPRHGV
jgi:maltooligosyltrehalose trehalohydrolase